MSAVTHWRPFIKKKVNIASTSSWNVPKCCNAGSWLQHAAYWCCFVFSCCSAIYSSWQKFVYSSASHINEILSKYERWMGLYLGGKKGWGKQSRVPWENCQQAAQKYWYHLLKYWPNLHPSTLVVSPLGQNKPAIAYLATGCQHRSLYMSQYYCEPWKSVGYWPTKKKKMKELKL